MDLKGIQETTLIGLGDGGCIRPLLLLTNYRKLSSLKPRPSGTPLFPWGGSLGTTGSSARLQSGVGQGWALI